MIDSDEKLEEWLPRIEQSPWIALDTEADSLHAYPEKLCLVQIGMSGGEILVDPLAGFPLDRLWEAFRDQELILHGADYDLRLLHRDGGFVPEAIFDTMLAARLVGCRQFGLTDLVSRFLGIDLEKGPQKANWARRPLTERMEAYALNDVRYLPDLAKQLRRQLQEKGRLAWHQEWCARLIQECSLPRRPDPDKIWRVKGSHQLGPEALAVLRDLWKWREGEALHSNKPPYFILAPATMVSVAAGAVHGENIDSLLPPRLSARRRAGVRQAVRRGLKATSLPQRPRRSGRRPTEAEKARFSELERKRNRQAEQLDIDPTLIASRATLMLLARDWEGTAPDLMSWQLALLNSKPVASSRR